MRHVSAGGFLGARRVDVDAVDADGRRPGEAKLLGLLLRRHLAHLDRRLAVHDVGQQFPRLGIRRATLPVQEFDLHAKSLALEPV